MPSRIPDPAFWAGRRVFLTGHTGFKGAWMAFWLARMGARVHGYALAPGASAIGVPGPDTPTDGTGPAAVGRVPFFHAARLDGMLDGSIIADLRDPDRLRQAMADAKPEVVFHLAAQPLVRDSYRDPSTTFAVNVQGTVNVLEAVRACPSVKAVVVVTTDKVYENREWDHPYREPDPLGGFDPYSSSKACTEIVAASYRQSFLAGAGIGIATARAGNVIGGGDVSAERLVPDCARALAGNQTIVLRNPDSVRPWQHVIEPLSGYMVLAESLFADPSRTLPAFNFGPDPMQATTVGEVVRAIVGRWCGQDTQGRVQVEPPPEAFHEANLLRLDVSRAASRLGWRPVFGFEASVGLAVDWYRGQAEGADLAALSGRQIDLYVSQSSAQ